MTLGLIFLAIAHAGCTENSAAPGNDAQGSSPPGVTGIDSVNFSSLNFSSSQTGLTAAIRILKDTNATIEWGTPNHPSGLREIEACTLARWSLREDGNEIRNSTEFRFPLDIFSAGHGLAASQNGRVADAPVGAPATAPVLRVRASTAYLLKAGSEIIADLGAIDGNASPLQTFFTMTASESGAFQVIETKQRQFACGPNIQTFEGNYISTGDAAGSVLHIERAAAKAGSKGEDAEAWLLFWPTSSGGASSLPSECHVEITLDGASAAKMDGGSPTAFCLAHVHGKGSLEFILLNSYGHAPIVAHALWQ